MRPSKGYCRLWIFFLNQFLQVFIEIFEFRSLGFYQQVYFNALKEQLRLEWFYDVINCAQTKPFKLIVRVGAGGIGRSPECYGFPAWT
jgi:hypothetical protein